MQHHGINRSETMEVLGRVGGRGGGVKQGEERDVFGHYVAGRGRGAQVRSVVMISSKGSYGGGRRKRC